MGKQMLLILSMMLLVYPVLSKNLHVGVGYFYSTLSQACNDSDKGDTILLHNGSHSTSQHIENLRGTEQQPIVIMAALGESPVFDGGSQAIHFVNVEYIVVSGLVFKNQYINGVNVDDGGDYSSPSKCIEFRNCEFRDMDASGNNDLLKMSGVDQFTVKNCTFENGAKGGSGIDLVGCHQSRILQCRFENMGSNSIQIKGGSSGVKILQNYFINGGYRSVNLGGSTGLAYFRPKDAGYEASKLEVYSNIFSGSEAPIAFVGCTETKVINNTIINPEKWVVRILQESVAERFAMCGNNCFENNLVFYGNISVETNIGPNTLPKTFTYSNNLWYNYENELRVPAIPVEESNQICGQSPLFVSADNNDLHLDSASPAISNGKELDYPQVDFYGDVFNRDRCIGAIAWNSSSNKDENEFAEQLIYPNPVKDQLQIEFVETKSAPRLMVYNMQGNRVLKLNLNDKETSITADVSLLKPGLYFIHTNWGTVQSFVKI